MTSGSNRKKKRLVTEYTTTICHGCGATDKRRFRHGDVVFEDAPEPCPECGGAVMIDKIFGEILE